VVLILYDLIYTNKRFRKVFLTHSAPKPSSTTSEASSNNGSMEQHQQPPLGLETSETGLSAFLSFASYLLQHNRTQRSSPYAQLCLVIIQIMVEDPATYPYICSIPQSHDVPSILTDASGIANAANTMAAIRLCRQRQPVLPIVKQSRPMAAVILDVILGFLKHNMKKKLQIDSYR